MLANLLATVLLMGTPPPDRAKTAGPATTVSTTVRAPIGDVFTYAVAADVLPKVLKRFGPIPPIVGTQTLHGPWERVGADRRVLMEGGGALHEQITHFARPTYFAYQIDQFEKTPLRALATRGVGSFVFTDLGGATRIDWTYSFAPKSAVATPLVAAFASTFYRGFMKQGLALMKIRIEGASSRRAPRTAVEFPARPPLRETTSPVASRSGGSP